MDSLIGYYLLTEVSHQWKLFIRLSLMDVPNVKTCTAFFLVANNRFLCTDKTKQISFKVEISLKTSQKFVSDHYIVSIFNFSLQHSGFDRGHLTAAANHRMNQNLCDETFLLSNMAPQVYT